uniref:Cyclic nucleotide-binding domain-containing protein n=1 Tax=Macrostomum lignano TaxID=282301 RepID=A0A1I8HBA1_9PLAT
KDPAACRRNYMSTPDFKLDIAALLPLDLLYFAIGVLPIVRIPRLLKLKTFWTLFDLLDKMAKNGHAVRITRTLIYMLYIIHLEACLYYIVSRWEGFGINDWVYDARSNVTAYIYCFYFATKTAGSVGNNPKPNNVIEQTFMVCYWLAGVFVFALLIGQISEIVQAASANKTTYRTQMDTTVLYMKGLNAPDYMIEKVRTWFDYNWEQQKTLDETSLLKGLPKKLKTDLAISVHFAILSKVSLFQDCERALLSDLILKLKPVLYLPGDYICKKGEVGMEMYIIMNGQVEVVGGPNNSIVFVTLKEGSVFGEISLMSLSGGNRRTADVRSKGFATLFTLSKADFEEAMQDYPQAYALLKKRAKKTLTKDKAKKVAKKSVQIEEVIKEREPTPKLLKTVIQVKTLFSSS